MIQWNRFQEQGANDGVTISDVARKAGVGVGTVSRVINRSPRVSEATRQRVLQVMAELDYSPNPFARRLSLGKTLTLAVIVPFFTRPSFVERLRGIEAAIAETEYDLIVYNAESVDKRDAYFRRMSRPERIDGLIIISLSPSDEDIQRFRNSGVPIVLVDARHPEVPQVIVDDVKGGYLATRHLLDLGHTRIAFLGDAYPNPFNFTSSHHRHAGYQRALDEARIDPLPKYYVTGEHGRDVAHELTQQLLSLQERPTAIVSASDTQAMGALRAARERDIPVPEALSVIGYDDIEIAEYLNLTTIYQPLFESGWQATRLLFQTIQGNSPETIYELPIKLVKRGTAAPPE
ncbi:MAG: LacI family DNA-binding transcriptional regulator [Anaerolineae bacterium]